MAAPADGDRDAVLGHASALRILKTCLFYPPLQALSGVVGRGGGRSGGIGVGGGMMGGGGKGAGAGAGANLVARVLPAMSPPCEAARSAMDVSDSDLQQLLDKLVLVRTWGNGGAGGGRGGEVVMVMVVAVVIVAEMPVGCVFHLPMVGWDGRCRFAVLSFLSEVCLKNVSKSFYESRLPERPFLSCML